ncbi:hypothetical protein B0A48_12782 [Cryoendolithus antarcticus]|uniref:Ubiquitin thioesterase OTU n=1 Tax=Cryoendolithus antarcticus TaxID=1507870 RepID=A0A1V8SRE3_9PEZI|nr:hypothetical protein B0A48_12782 [Cryoendolithus antarcticus]
MRLRVRGPDGVSTINIESSATWADLKAMISKVTSVPDFDIKYGYPPKPLNTESIDNATLLSDLDIKLDGEQLIVMARDVQSQLSSPMAKSNSSASAAGSLPQTKSFNPPQHTPSDFPDKPLNLTRKPQTDIDSDPPTVHLLQLSSVLTIRIMPDDNSCLFRALSSALLGPSLDGMTELRSIVAQTIASNPDLYSTAVLERPPDDYCKWIQNPDSWGGGIELAILSQEFGVEVCSVNVQDGRVDRFNEGQSTRCILVYSGIHYDVLAATPYAGADPEHDRKVFEVLRMEEGEAMDGGVLEAAKELCKVLRERHYFTDTKGFDVKCNVCGQSGKGEKWAVTHANGTGHVDFGEGGG